MVTASNQRLWCVCWSHCTKIEHQMGDSESVSCAYVFELYITDKKWFLSFWDWTVETCGRNKSQKCHDKFSTTVVTCWMFFFLTSFFCFLFSFLFSRYCSNGVKPHFLSFSFFWTSSSAVSFRPTPHETSSSTSRNFFCCSCSSIPCSKARYFETGSSRFSFVFSSSSWTVSVKYQLT